MNVWGWIALGTVAIAGVVILIADPFGWKDNNADRYRLERDSVIVEAAEWKRLYTQEVINRKNCEERGVVRVIETVPVPDQRALQYVMATLREYKDSLEAAKKIAEKLQPSLFSDPIGYNFADEFVEFGLYAYGKTTPLDNEVEVHYNLTKYNLKKKQIEYVEREIPVEVSASYFFVGGGTSFIWATKSFEPFLNIGANLDVGKFVLDFKALEPRYSFNLKKVEVATRVELKYKLN